MPSPPDAHPCLKAKPIPSALSAKPQTMAGPDGRSATAETSSPKA